MIKLSRIIEQQGTESQYYDLGRDFANFRRTIDGADDQIKSQFEKTIGAKLVGKRIRARASRGYKQYIKDYEFDVTKISLDDYYDNYVVVAHDNSTPKAKEYFLKPGFKVQILGAATGQPSPQKGGKPEQPNPQTTPQPTGTSQFTQQPIAQFQQPMNSTPSQPVRENSNGFYDAYSIDDISKDIKQWLPNLLVKPETVLRDFIKGIGWQKQLDRGTKVTLFDLKIPVESLVKPIDEENIRAIFSKLSNQNTRYDLVKMELTDTDDEWKLRVKKTITTI